MIKNDMEANLPGRTTSTIKLITTTRCELNQWMDRGVVPQNRDSENKVGTILPGRTTSTIKLTLTPRCELSQWMDRGVVPQPGQRQRGWDKKRGKAETRKCDTKTCGVSVRVVPTIPLFLSMLVLERRKNSKIDLNCGVFKKR